jgi:hypothetical protein
MRSLSDVSNDENGRRITLRLDPMMISEGLIVDRLDKMPKVRHQAWLRSLLVVGYLQEARVFSALQNKHATHADAPLNEMRKNCIPPSNYSRWFGQSRHQTDLPSDGGDKQMPDEPQTPRASVSGKPFAILRKVIG